MHSHYTVNVTAIGGVVWRYQITRWRSVATMAIDFVNEVAALSEEHHHHPNIHIDYTCVRLSLSTHDDGNIVTAKDHQLATAIDLLYQKHCL